MGRWADVWVCGHVGRACGLVTQAGGWADGQACEHAGMPVGEALSLDLTKVARSGDHLRDGNLACLLLQDLVMMPEYIRESTEGRG